MITQHTFKSPQALAKAFAHYLADQIHASDTFHLALSGGSTPKLLFDILARDYANKIDWQKVHLYWGDERCVAPTDADSNYRMTQERLIRHIDIPADKVHRIWGEAGPAAEADRYGGFLEMNLPLDNGWPVFDLIILGMGADGHTASIFPDQMELMTSDKVCAVARHPESGQNRITLTGTVINAAKEIHFLVTGDGKKEVLGEIFSGTEEARVYPAAWVDEAEWWLG